MSFATIPDAIIDALTGHASVPLGLLRRRLPQVPLLLLRFHLARLVEAGRIVRLSADSYRLPDPVLG